MKIGRYWILVVALFIATTSVLAQERQEREVFLPEHTYTHELPFQVPLVVIENLPEYDRGREVAVAEMPELLPALDLPSMNAVFDVEGAIKAIEHRKASEDYRCDPPPLPEPPPTALDQ